MDIIIRPDNISLVGSMKRVVVSTKEEITFILSYVENGAPIVQHTYTPDGHGRIEISLEDIIAPLLYFELQDIESAYLQNHIARDFKVTIRYEGEKTKAFTFTAIRAGVDRLADSAENFLKGNFLTWQPSVKPVTYNTPEFLTYYALTEGFVKCVGYHTERIVGLVKGDEKTIANLQKDKAQTIPVQYAIMAKLFGFLPEYYDVWVEDTEGKRLTYIQRYYASDIRSEEEQWILFENSLGGIDTFRAYGDTTFTAKHTHNIAEIENDAEEYRVDTAREYKKNTGHLNKEERRWLLDFFPSLGKYVYIDNYVRRIVVTDSEASYEAKELPSNFEFTFKYADARPYLNLRRSAVPAKMMDIKVPELGSFTIAPRLVEFQRLNLSSGALFPVQNPYADEWNVTTIAAIIDFIVEVLEKSYSANGGIGHTHDNFSLLQSLSLLNGYLLENGNKIKAGYADKARDLETPVDDRFLSKLKSDTARGLITFLKGLTFGDSLQTIGFAQGLNGFKVWLDSYGKAHGQIDYLEVLGKAVFRSLQVDEYKHIGGNIVLSGANGVIDKVVHVEGGWKCYFHTDDGEKAVSNDWEPGDQALCQTFNIKAGVYENVSNSYYWRCVSEVAQKTDAEEAYIVITDDDTYRDKNIENDEPKAGDNIVLCGHNTLWDIAHGVNPTLHRSRMNVTMITTSKEVGGTIEVYRNVHEFKLDKSNATFHLTSEKVSMNSARFEWISADGSRIPNVIYRGDWVPGTVAAKYEAWYHSRGTWLSLVDDNTDEPTEQSTKWKKYAAKGEDGTSPYTVRVLSESGGNIIHNGQGQIVLVATVFHGENDITADLQPFQFLWEIQTGNTDFDTAWNARHKAVGNRITVRAEEVTLKAQINCLVEIEK
ncbi:hypothetical protein [Prevotella intermedia]|uniref:Uncharacterized protein n=1 Tax=Prevotella intermedia TaxID=28131 RepID=A0A424ZAT3_PREIN|nr:hypothetical protein [Prevotella intermedia]RQE06863.1 hypothetical protein D2S53_00245 [Prevotella intermedia]RRF88325.1 hypothetical protein D2S45_00245 [Prevotella intermedia]